jgi:hypothetical protein
MDVDTQALENAAAGRSIDLLSCRSAPLDLLSVVAPRRWSY